MKGNALKSLSASEELSVRLLMFCSDTQKKTDYFSKLNSFRVFFSRFMFQSVTWSLPPRQLHLGALYLIIICTFVV